MTKEVANKIQDACDQFEDRMKEIPVAAFGEDDERIMLTLVKATELVRQVLAAL
jgi:hypothetical protein